MQALLQHQLPTLTSSSQLLSSAAPISSPFIDKTALPALLYQQQQQLQERQQQLAAILDNQTQKTREREQNSLLQLIERQSNRLERERQDSDNRLVREREDFNVKEALLRLEVEREKSRRHEVELRKLMKNSMTFFILFSQKRRCENNSTDRINNDNYSSLYATLEYAGFKSTHIEKTLDIVIVRSKYEVESL